jgi:beta-lactamase superfamily II metal-dependent hydrolase
MRASIVPLALAISATVLVAQTRKTLDIYVVDVEGGNATLFVTPSGQSVLIDTGNVAPAAAVRDADRIAEAAKDAGITQIDHLITTHWHGDHFGGMAEVAKRLPIKAFYDHGTTIEPQPASSAFLKDVYPGLIAGAKYTDVKPGDKIPVAGLDWRVIASGGEVLKQPLPGAGRPNPFCASFQQQNVDKTENAQSVGSHITFGKFRVVHPGDLTWNKEAELMCPNNPLGTADLLIVGHHGQAVSNSEVIVHALRPRVSIINNGTRKGGQPSAMRILLNSPGLEDLWQVHFSLLSGQEYTVPGMFISNLIDEQPESMPIAFLDIGPGGGGGQAAGAPPPPPPPAHNGKAYWFKVSAQQDGTFTVTNQRNNFAKTYRAMSGTN